MKKYAPFVILLGISVVFFWKFFLYGLLPIPSDTIVGLYHPFRDYYRENYPNGIPFKNFLITDPVRQQYPWRHEGVEQVKQGALPGWNPYVFAGTPHAANYQSALFYPLNILLFVLPFQIGWSSLVILQPFLAGIFMYLYLRKMRLSNPSSMLGATVYSFSGFSIAWLTWNTLGHVALWLPLILYLKENILALLQNRKLISKPLIVQGIFLIFAESMYVLAGHTQTAFYLFCISNVYLFARVFHMSRDVKRAERVVFLKRTTIFYSLSAPFIFAVTAIQTLPFMQFVFRSGRTGDQDFGQQGWFIPFKHLIQFLAPDFFGNPATLNYWGVWNYGELVGYVGVVPFVLVIVSLFFIKRKMVLFFATIAFIALLFSTDNFLAKIPFLLHIPFLSTSQPTRLLFVVDFCFAVLASIGFDAVLHRKLSQRNVMYIAVCVIVLYGLVWLSTYFQTFTQDLEDLATSRRNLIIPTFLASFGLSFLFTYNRVTSRYRVFITSLLLCIVAIDLLRFGWKFTPFTKKEYLYPTPKSLEFLQSQSGLFRIMKTDDRLLPPNFSTMYKLQIIDGYDPLYLKNYGELASALVRNAPDISPYSFNRIISIYNPDNKIIDLMNVKYVLSMSDLNYPHLVKVYEEGETKVYENRRAQPRAFLVSSIIQAATKQEVIHYLFDELIDLRTTAIVQEPITLSETVLEPDETVIITSYLENSVEMKTDTKAVRLLILSDAYYPNWKAYIDDVEVSLLEVNYAFRGVVVPQGAHTIVFRYNLL